MSAPEQNRIPANLWNDVVKDLFPQAKPDTDFEKLLKELNDINQEAVRRCREKNAITPVSKEELPAFVQLHKQFLDAGIRHKLHGDKLLWAWAYCSAKLYLSS